MYDGTEIFRGDGFASPVDCALECEAFDGCEAWAHRKRQKQQQQICVMYAAGATEIPADRYWVSGTDSTGC